MKDHRRRLTQPEHRTPLLSSSISYFDIQNLLFIAHAFAGRGFSDRNVKTSSPTSACSTFNFLLSRLCLLEPVGLGGRTGGEMVW